MTRNGERVGEGEREGEREGEKEIDKQIDRKQNSCAFQDMPETEQVHSIGNQSLQCSHIHIHVHVQVKLYNVHVYL